MKPLRKWKIFGFLTRRTLFSLIIGGFAGLLFMVVLIEFDHFTSSEAFLKL